jgi:AraC family transcriptional regulator
VSTNRAPDAVGQVIKMIYKQFAQPLTVADMAQVANYSRFHFSREFRRATGVTPGRFLATVRIQEAKRLLLTTTLSISQVATGVGYSSVGTFSAKFKNIVGLSPSAYRAVAFGLGSTGPAAGRQPPAPR